MRETNELHMVPIQNVTVTEDSLTVDLSDGRTVSVPLTWFPRLLHGTLEERNHWRLIGDGEGIHWKDLDEDISADFDPATLHDWPAYIEEMKKMVARWGRVKA